MMIRNSTRAGNIAAAISLACFTPLAFGQTKYTGISDTFIDSGSPGSPDPATGQPNGGSSAIVNGQDIYSYGADGKTKAVTSNYSSSYPFVSATHVLLTLPASFWTAIGTGPVESAVVNIYPFNDSLNISDAHDNLELHPLTRAFTVGDGTQSPLVPSTDGGATWETPTGAVADTWTTPGGDFDAANYVDATVTDATLPVSKSTTPFTWDITSLVNNPTSRAELQDYGALIKVVNEGQFPANISIPPGVNDFVSFYSADYMTAMNTTNTAYVPNVVASQPAFTWNNAGGSGDGTTWDTNGNQNFNNGSGATTFSTGGTVLFSDINNGHYAVQLNSTVTPGAVAFDDNGTYTVSGTGSIAGTGSLTKTSAGTVTLATSNTYTGGTNVRQGTLIFAASGSLPAYTNLTIGLGAQVQVANHTGSATDVLQINSLVSAGLIDLTNNALVVRAASALTFVTNQIKLAYNNGAWNGSTGITSSLAATDTAHLTAVGVATGLTSFEGQTVLATDVLAKYTYYGDANLDGVVDASDYSRIDSGFVTGASGWSNGDFNYDGIINGSDYTLIDNAFNTQGVALSAQVYASPTAEISTSSAVPEPATVSVLTLGALGLLSRRRRI